jgi:hypothetical protein
MKYVKQVEIHEGSMYMHHFKEPCFENNYDIQQSNGFGWRILPALWSQFGARCTPREIKNSDLSTNAFEYRFGASKD